MKKKKNAVSEKEIERREGERLVALAGNPNVGKSTLFNLLTGMNQHTGNWTGKTVSAASGRFTHKEKSYLLCDLPGTYSLNAHSAEEEVARDFICFSGADAALVVCDASCLERNLNLVLQTSEITRKCVVAVNLMDEAAKKQITVDCRRLSCLLGVPVCPITARSGEGVDELLDALAAVCDNPAAVNDPTVIYEDEIEGCISRLTPLLERRIGSICSSRFAAVHLLEYDSAFTERLSEAVGYDVCLDEEIAAALDNERARLTDCGFIRSKLNDSTVTAFITKAEDIANACVSFGKPDYYERDRRIDKLLTHPVFGVPLMLLLLAAVFWITIKGANVPSEMLSNLLFGLSEKLNAAIVGAGAPEWLRGALIDGVYRTLAWVVSVMLPPMAIFFPLFTILEDIGYLPRIAFTLDRYFKHSGACGKQALTMAMGFGCNAAGVTGCRIIDSPRERLIAMLTNCLVPCNGRFPMLILIISMFAAGSGLIQAGALTAIILMGIILTLLMSRILSKTILKGETSSFTLELPPYRRPQIGKIIVRSIFDRTLFVLGRAITSAAPAGLIIWLCANLPMGDSTILGTAAGFLDPFARLMGLDGIILMAFILGLPANEIVIPIMLMGYMCSGTLTEVTDPAALLSVLRDNGWTLTTALCTMIFSLCHFPCATTLMTIKKESGSRKWAFAAFLLPTVMGIILCIAVAAVGRLII